MPRKSWWAFGTRTLQQITNGQDGQNQLFGEGSVDLTLLYRPMVRTTLFIDFEPSLPRA